MKKFRWQLLIILVTGLIVGVLLIVQQLGNGEEADTTPSPISGGIYTEALIGDFMRLNPFLDIYNSADRDVDQLIFSSLIRFDSRGLPQADLAESWGVSKDGTVYNFSLRSDVYWHDGEVFDSSDVVYSVELLKSDHPLIPEDLKRFWADVEIVALTENKLQFLLPEPFAPFLDYLSFGILPEHLLSGLDLEALIDHSFNLAPVGTGPFRFQRLLVENNKIVGVVLEAFDAYYLERPYLDEIIFRHYPTPENAFTAYKNGDVEGISNVNASILQKVLAEPHLAVYSTRKPLLTMAYLNLNNPAVSFLQNPDFRRALLTSINRELIIERVYGGQAVVANGPIMPGTWAFYSDLENVDYDPVLAESLFDATDLTYDEEEKIYKTEAGLGVALTLIHPETREHLQIAEMIKENWEALGVEVTLESKPYEDVLTALETREYQALLVDLNLASSPDPDPYPFWGQAQIGSGQNYAEWDNRSASEFLEQARMMVDLGERERLYRNFQVVFMRELPSLPLFYPIYTYAITDVINGIGFGPIFDPSDRFNNVYEWYILSSTEKLPTETAEPDS
ncbi:MAG: ABC transporter substrate-binding protein [Brevefilum sp.]|jgi:peptide/nickel transport system substrate-binding protein